MPSLEKSNSKPWPEYFIVRKDVGEIVPLIAADELPLGIDLVNVPRYLQLQEAKGMLNLGIVPGPNACYEVSLSDDFEYAPSVTDNAEKLKHNISQLSSPSKPPHQLAPIPTALNTSPSSPRSTARPSSSIRPTNQVCRHWCHHGICKWGQRCRYRHIMPMTFSGLESVGLIDWPAWYRSLNPGYFAPDSARMGKVQRARLARVRSEEEASEKLKGEKVVKSVRNGGKEREKEGTRENLRAPRKEEVGDQIVRRLRKMAREEEDGKGKGVGMGFGIGGGKVATGMVERAVGGGTRRWEDESEDGDEMEGEESETEEQELKKKEVTQRQGKLVDV